VVEGTDTGDARLSLSATDQHVQVELPGIGVTEEGQEAQVGGNGKTGRETSPVGANIAEPRRITLSVKVPCGKEYSREGIDLLSEGGMRPTEGLLEGGGVDKSTTLATMEISKATSVATTSDVGSGQASIASVLEMGANEMMDTGGKRVERRRMLCDIETAMSLSVHLATTNPELTLAASFLNAVCGRASGDKREKNESGGKTTVAVGEMAVLTANEPPPNAILDGHPAVNEVLADPRSKRGRGR